VADDCKDDLTQGGVHRDETLEETVQTSGRTVVRIETGGRPSYEGEEDSVGDTLSRGCRGRRQNRLKHL
jgi:hypothetical protein